MSKNNFKRAVLLALIPCTLASCGGPAGPEIPAGSTTITLWGWGDEAEINVFTNLLKDYNDNNKENIYVNFVKKTSGSYYSSLETNLTGRQAPDLFYVGDSMVKRYASADYLEDLTPYIEASEKIDTNDLWSTLMQRYQFNPQTFLPEEGAPTWGLPKDIGPTVIYYNEDAFKAQDITIISAKDDDGDGIVTIDGTNYPAVGYDATTKVFNNKIPMTFEELEAISTLLNHDTALASKHQTKWSFYSSWWFWAGWSVGGDCIQFKESDDPKYNGGYWEFTLDDEKPNYRVLKDVTINNHEYKANSFVDYYDLEFMQTYNLKQSLIDNGTIVELPSIKEMFEYWISYFQRGLSPKPEDISTELSLFTNEEVAMYVTGRYDTVQFRKNANFNWDCAPLPRHKDGVTAGHSGSMCLSMGKRSRNKDKAFKVMEYLCGVEGQDALAETGFNVPSQMSLAKDPTKNFLNSDKMPRNNEVFLDAAEIQKGGDWTYLTDDTWINIWAPTLNTDVLNGKKTVTQLFDTYKSKVNEELKKYTERA